MMALITGAAGQQGSYLTELLLEKGYDVCAMIRPNEALLSKDDRVRYYYCGMTESKKISKIILDTRPDEIYNLAAMNNVAQSFEMPNLAMSVNCGGFVRIIESVKDNKLNSKIYFAASSEVFGDPVESPQSETTPFSPRSPYGVSKAAAVYIARIYRALGMKIYCGILYNNESPRRPEEYVTRKICKHAASVIHGNQEKLRLGNLDARRDFGYAKEYVEWTWRIMQYHTPDDFIMATGITHSIREVLKIAFDHVGKPRWEKYIEVDESLYRPSESKELVGDITKSKTLLGFEPKVALKELIKIMVQHELDQYRA